MRPASRKDDSRSCRALCSTHVNGRRRVVREAASGRGRPGSRRRPLDRPCRDLDRGKSLRVVRLLARTPCRRPLIEVCSDAAIRGRASAASLVHPAYFLRCSHRRSSLQGALTLSSPARGSGMFISAAPDLFPVRLHHAASAWARAIAVRQNSLFYGSPQQVSVVADSRPHLARCWGVGARVLGELARDGARISGSSGRCCARSTRQARFRQTDDGDARSGRSVAAPAGAARARWSRLALAGSQAKTALLMPALEARSSCHSVDRHPAFVFRARSSGRICLLTLCVWIPLLI